MRIGDVGQQPQRRLKRVDLLTQTAASARPSRARKDNKCG